MRRKVQGGRSEREMKHIRTDICRSRRNKRSELAAIGGSNDLYLH